MLDPEDVVGVGKVLVSSLEQRRTAHRLYERIGFSRLGGIGVLSVGLIADEYDL
ncbi:hypothetical protein [Amycolatopsis panacis]|uniref:hypothetical protein n=1 Tax=Amycolatopsis panacis TaxID=2340917 RepID=UPI001314C414|nr:hypothetical protein [Amycolatopsis panacis]